MSDCCSNASLASSIAQAIKVLRNGGVVAFPTETYYGLAVDCFNPAAVAHLFAIKKRDLSKPLLLLVANETQLSEVVAAVPASYLPLMRKYWPGPLTLLFPVNHRVPSLVSAGTGTVGIRISPHPIANMLVAALGRPITATSANISGRPAAENADDIELMFGFALPWVVDGGSTQGGAPSTIVGLIDGRPCIIRQGILQLDPIDLM